MRTLILAVACLLASMGAAAAHAMLEHATPAAGSTLTDAPAVLVLQYSEVLEPAFSGVSVVDENGRDMIAGPPSASGTVMRVPLKSMTLGTYRVTWHAVSVDTHRTEGSYDFRVAP